MTLDPVRRSVARTDAICARNRSVPDTYAPFTIDEYRGMPLDDAFLDQCGSWPAMTAAEVASMAKLRNAPYPNVPALVISGDLDNMTPLADGTMAAKRFPHGRQLVVPNGFHVNALTRGGTFEITVAADGTQLTLHDVRWTKDLRVSGTVVYPGRTGDGVADLTVAGPEGATGTLKAHWIEGVAKARAQVHGTFGKSAVAAEGAAP